MTDDTIPGLAESRAVCFFFDPTRPFTAHANYNPMVTAARVQKAFSIVMKWASESTMGRCGVLNCDG
jgi:hypothetical protein